MRSRLFWSTVFLAPLAACSASDNLLVPGDAMSETAQDAGGEPTAETTGEVAANSDAMNDATDVPSGDSVDAADLDVLEAPIEGSPEAPAGPVPEGPFTLCDVRGLGMPFRVAFTPDGDRFVVAAEGPVARVYRSDTGEEDATMWGGLACGVAIAPDGASIVGGCDDELSVWSFAGGLPERVLTSSFGGFWAGSSAVFSPDGTLLAFSEFGKVRVLAYDTGDEVALQSDGVHFGAMAFAPEGDAVFAVHGSNVDRVKLDDGAIVRSFVGHSGSVNDVVLVDAGKLLVSGGTDKTARLWNAETGASIATLTGHTSHVTSVGASANGEWIVTGGNDGQVLLWNRSGGAEGSFGPSLGAVPDVAITAGGDLVAAVTADGSVRLWKRSTGEVQHNVHTSRPMTHAALAPDATSIATGTNDGRVSIWPTAAGDHSSRLIDESTGTIWSAVYTHDGTVVASTWETEVRLWRISDGVLLDTIDFGDLYPRALVFSPDDTRLAVAVDKLVRIVKVATPSSGIVQLKGHTDTVLDVDWSSDGTLIVSGSSDNTARLWNAEDGSFVRQVARFEWMRHQVGIARFSPDGKTLALGQDDDVDLWDVATETMVPKRTLSHDFAAVWDARFSPDGNTLATATMSGGHVWRLSDGKALVDIPSGLTLNTLVMPDLKRIATVSLDVISWWCSK